MSALRGGGCCCSSYLEKQNKVSVKKFAAGEKLAAGSSSAASYAHFSGGNSFFRIYLELALQFTPKAEKLQREADGCEKGSAVV